MFCKYGEREMGTWYRDRAPILPDLACKNLLKMTTIANNTKRDSQMCFKFQKISQLLIKTNKITIKIILYHTIQYYNIKK